MAIQVDSNLLLKAKDFLDRRQSLAVTLRDLYEWDYDNFPIPVGFEVYVEGQWYTFMGKSGISNDSLTGYFRERGGINVVQETGSSINDVMSQKAVTDELNNLSEIINSIISSDGKILKVEILPYDDKKVPGKYSISSSIIPGFAWKVYYNDVEIDPVDLSDVGVYLKTVEDGEEILKSVDKVSGNQIFVYTNSNNQPIYIRENTTFVLKISYGVGSSKVSTQLELDYKFLGTKYWGKIPSNLISGKNGEELYNYLKGDYNISSDRSEYRETGVITFDCSLEEYKNIGLCPGIVIPSDLINSNEYIPFRVLVGGIEVSDYTMKSYDSQEDGRVNIYVLNTPQRGILNIEFT